MNIKDLIIATIAGGLVLFSNFISWKYGNTQGIKEGFSNGVDMYHQICYTGVPPTLMFGDDGTVVLCGPLTEVPQEEIKRFKPDT